MTEQELITSMQALTLNASSVLAALVPYAEQNADVTITLANGQAITVPSLPKQVSTYAAQQAADRLSFLQNFAGLPSSQTVTRDTANRLSTVTTNYATGYQTIHTLTRDAVTGRITGVSVVCKDNLGATVATITKTINRVGGLYSGVI